MTFESISSSVILDTISTGNAASILFNSHEMLAGKVSPTGTTSMN